MARPGPFMSHLPCSLSYVHQETVKCLRVLAVGLGCYKGTLSLLGRFPKKLRWRTIDEVLTSTGTFAALDSDEGDLLGNEKLPQEISTHPCSHPFFILTSK